MLFESPGFYTIIFTQPTFPPPPPPPGASPTQYPKLFTVRTALGIFYIGARLKPEFSKFS
jgi:hypothetical protein